MVAVSQRQIAAGVAFLATAVILQWRFDALKSLLAGLLAVPVFVAAGVAFLAAGALVAVTRLDKTQQVPSFRERQRDATRSLAFAVGNKWAKALAERQIEDMEEQFDAIYGLEGPKVSSRLDQLLSLIRGSFILPWYMKISPSRAFPDAVECNVRHALGQVGRRAEVVDWPNLVVYRILPIVTEHFQHYRSIEHLSASITATPSSSLPLPLPRSPHAALNARNRISAESNIPAIEDHFRATVARILADVLPASEQSEVVSTIVREIVLGAILLPVFNMLCDSDFWNRQIDEQGGKYLYERKQVNKVLSALSTQTSHPAGGSPQRSRPQKFNATITVHSTSKQFDEFMRSIPRLKTLAEARRLRSDVDRELRSARTALNKMRTTATSEDMKNATRRLVRYVDRLERARSHIDRRIGILSGGVSPRSGGFPSDAPTLSRFKGSLYTILSDPSSLAYWLEFMERRDRSHLVQFWLTVEGFKDPLEASGQNLALENVTEEGEAPPAVNDATIVDDTAFLYQTYFDKSEHTIAIPPKLVAEIAEVASHTSALGLADARRAKRAVYESQRLVYEQMELEDWPAFQKSPLYIKAIADLKNTRPRPSLRSVSYSPPAAPGSPLPPPPDAVRSLSDNPPPQAPKRPYLVNGSFSPVTSTPLLPTFTSAQDLNAPMRKVTPERFASPLGTPEPLMSPGLPSAIADRKSKNLDVLFGNTGADTDGSEERDPLFDDGEEEDEAAQLEAQRMEAIQVALNEIMSEDMRSTVDLSALREREHTPLSPTMDSGSLYGSFDVDPLTMSVELVWPERHPLAGNKLTSRSAEDISSMRDEESPSPPTPARRAAQLDERIAARKKRLARRGSLEPARPTHQSTKSIFADDQEDEEATAESAADGEDTQVDDVQLAAPGMELSVEIARLDGKIAELDQQASLLNSLISQAELTGNQKELKLLTRSQSSLMREQRAAQFQKTQYEQQREENRLVPGRTQVSIPSTLISRGDHEGGRQIVRYNVEIKQTGEDGRVLTSWIVTHRYNEFYQLDRRLHDWATASTNPQLAEDMRKTVDLPGKRLVPNMSANFVETRRAALEKYLQSLLILQTLCDSPIVRGFLSKSPVSSDLVSSTGSLGALAPASIVKSLYKTVASSLDEALVPSMLDLMSQSLSRQFQEVAGGIGVVTEAMPTALRVGGAWKSPTTAVSTLPALAMPPTLPSGAPSALPGAMQALEGESATTGSFTAPITDLFIEVFDLKEKDWLRRQAIVILLQQVLGGTIERKFRDTFRKATSEKGIDKLLRIFQDNMWPDGVRKPPTEPRTDQQRYDTRLSASRRLGALMPDVAANMIGRSNARHAASRMFGVLQDARLNQQLMLSVFDEVLSALFPPPS